MRACQPLHPSQLRLHAVQGAAFDFDDDLGVLGVDTGFAYVLLAVPGLEHTSLRTHSESAICAVGHTPASEHLCSTSLLNCAECCLLSALYAHGLYSLRMRSVFFAHALCILSGYSCVLSSAVKPFSEHTQRDQRVLCSERSVLLSSLGTLCALRSLHMCSILCAFYPRLLTVCAFYPRLLTVCALCSVLCALCALLLSAPCTRN